MFTYPHEAPLQLIEDEELNSFGVKLYIKREDLIHPYISGNKWRKLKYNLIQAKSNGFNIILTCGGAYSNHISAVAAAGKEFGFETVGIIRGEEHIPLNPTLSLAKEDGMRFHYWDRVQYRKGFDREALELLKSQFGEFYFIPEGGCNELAVEGCKEIVADIGIGFDYICSAVGTGGTLAGLISADSSKPYQALGFSALKNTGFLNEAVRSLIGNSTRRWDIINEYSFGGYAKFDNLLIRFINDFYLKHTIELDPIYTGKMMYGIYDLVKNGYFANGVTIIAVHTGGIQGKTGFNERFGKILL